MFSRRPVPQHNRGRIAVATGGAADVNFAALGAAFWIDASRPASYEVSGSDIIAFKSLISGTSLSTKVGGAGTMTLITDPRDGQPAFAFPTGTGWMKGSDAPYIAAVTGTNKPFCSIAVVELRLPSGNYAIDSVQNSATTGNGQFFLASAGSWYMERDGAPTGPARLATSENSAAGLCVVVQSSIDGLTVRTSVNGLTETSAAAFATAGALTPNQVGIGAHVSSVENFGFFGTIRERAFFGSNKTFTEYSPWVAALMRKWPGTAKPCVYFVGDSITTAQAATNGGMPALLAQRMQALGAYADPIGPLSVGQPFPYAHSAVSGNTCAQMNTRILDATLGLGQGGASKGLYRRAKLICLFAGTNGQSVADYTTLLNNVYSQAVQAQPGARIAVTTITDISGSTAAVTAFNDALTAAGTGVWDVFEAAHPGVLIRWDAFSAAPWNGTDFVDSTHPSNSGYEKLVDNPTYGLLQAVLLYLMSIQ